MRPNGNIDHATEMNTEQYDEIMVHQRWRKHPRVLPLASPKTEQHEYVPLPVCNHESCKSTSSGGYLIGKAVRHGEMCTGDCPLWECHLVLRLLSPGLLMKELSSECRTVILASGSLAPLQSLCAELNLFAPKEETPSISTKEPLSNGFSYNFVDLTSPVEQGTPNKSAVFSGSQNKNIKKYFGRLQVKPKPLEADHVVNLKMQLFACAIGHFPDGKPLTVSYSNYKDDSFFPRLGDALATVIEAIPIGGVLVFFPSYNFLSKCIKCWNPSAQHSGDNPSSASPQVWSRFLESKSKVITEPTGSQDKFEVARNEYNEQIRLQKRCILLAVFRGKMSEGISFNDDHARAVICIGLPFPNSFDRNIRAKKAYNDEQRKICNNSNLLPGTEWYSQQAYRAIAQALGRCIRHGADYGAVILMDSRHCDDGSPNDGIPRCHKNLPKWMRHSMRTLSILPNSGVGLDPIVGGYRGLSQELRVFFQEAPPYANRILEQWRLDLESAQNRSSDQSVSCVFDGASGQWNISSTADRRSRGTTRVESEL